MTTTIRVSEDSLTSSDPEPEPGTMVVTDGMGVWVRFDDSPRSWGCVGTDDDTETWTRIAGNYGPVYPLVAS
jgi:hypothetical protein